MSNIIKLRRHDTGTPWGFRLNGGAEFGQPLYIQKVTTHSLGHRYGLSPGDAILQIGSTPVTGRMTHEMAKMEILRAGNELDFIIQKNAMHIEGADMESSMRPAPRSQVIEEESQWHAQHPQLQSRSFMILQQQLNTE